MVKLDKDEFEALRALSFLNWRNIRRVPARAGEAARHSRLSPQKMTALLVRFIGKGLVQKTKDGYLTTELGERAIEDNFVPDPAGIGPNRQWLEANAAAYWGRYVALRGNQLVANAASRRELMDELEAMGPHEEVLIVPLIEMGSMVVVEGERRAKMG